jgi:DNA-binding NtrC family response regulator
MAPTASQPTVLFVDDDHLLLAAMTRALRHEPYRILTETSGEAALLVLANEEIDVLVSDRHMPGMSGTELLKLVRRRWPTLVTILLSGRTDLDALALAVNEGGIFRYLPKPCDHGRLAETLRQAVAHKAARDRLARGAFAEPRPANDDYDPHETAE